MKRFALLLALVLAATPARAGDWIGDLFGAAGSWAATTRGNLATIAARYVGRGNVTGFKGPWCAVFLSRVVEEKTGRNPQITRARDFARIGSPSRLLPGAVVVQKHHVWISTGGTCGVGGNENNRVKYKCGRNLRGVIAIRSL